MNIILICPLHNGDDGREVLHQLLLPALYPGYDKLPRCRRYKISCRLERGLAAAHHGGRPRAAACCVLHPYRISALHCALSVVICAALCSLCHQKSCAIEIIHNNAIINKGVDIHVEEEEDVTAFAGIAASPKPSRRDFGQSTPATRADLASAMAEHTVSREGL